VEHLAGLLVALVVAHLTESRRQQPQRALGHPRHERHRLERRDEAVASEEGGEPRNARGIERMPVEVGAQQLEVVERPLEDAVE
jgi:hypothetical protein